MKKIIFFMALSVSFLFSAINLQTASKKDLMCIKGIGKAKADVIIKYRKANKLKSADDLLKIKGFGKALVKAVKNGDKNVKCGGKKSTQKTPAKKSNIKKTDDKSKSNKSDEKKIEKKSEDKKSSEKE